MKFLKGIARTIAFICGCVIGSLVFVFSQVLMASCYVYGFVGGAVMGLCEAMTYKNIFTDAMDYMEEHVWEPLKTKVDNL